MSAWFCTIASISFTCMMIYAMKGEMIIAVICAIAYIVGIFCGTICSYKQEQRIEKMEREINELKDNNCGGI